MPLIVGAANTNHGKRSNLPMSAQTRPEKMPSKMTTPMSMLTWTTMMMAIITWTTMVMKIATAVSTIIVLTTATAGSNAMGLSEGSQCQCKFESLHNPAET